MPLPDQYQISAPILVLVGPTAIGKTELALTIGERFGCEIVSMDSMQVYRYMDIGTAKPSAAEQERVTHHLIDLVNPDQQYNAACFVRDCLQAITRINQHGRLALITGGTGMYLYSLLNGLFKEVNVSDEIKKSVRLDLKTRGLAALYQELERVDSESANRIHPHDRQRIMRGVEIHRATGHPWSYWIARQRHQQPPAVFERILQIGLRSARETLYQRIGQRANIMLQQGLVEEVEHLRAMGYGPELASMRAIGYRQVNDLLDGLVDRKTMIEQLVRETRRYAKRQMTWFTRKADLQWHRSDDHGSVMNAIRKFLDKQD